MVEEKVGTKETKVDKFLAAVLIRSAIKSRKGVKETLKRLNLYDKLNCVIVPDNTISRGMLQKANHVITWGTVSSSVINEMSSIKKRGKAYRLHPPVGGFERKGVKVPYTLGGALGKRPSMDSLIKKMIKK